MRKDKFFDVLPYARPKKENKPKPKSERLVVVPTDNHPFRQSIHQIPLYSSDLAYPEIRNMLEDIFLAKYA
jgi:hypothetical protein